MAVKNLAWLTLLGAMAVVGCSGGGSNNSTAGLAPNKSAEQTKQEADLTDAEMSDPHAMETLKKLPDARLVGKYQVQIDETVIPAQAKRDPQYPEKLAKLQRESPTIEIDKDGGAVAMLKAGKASGFLSIFKDRTVLVLKQAKPQDKKRPVLTLPLKIYDNGDDFTIDLPGASSRPLYKKLPS